MNERALMVITRILEGYAEPPGIDWSEQEQEEVTFTGWALGEILLLVWDHPWTPASKTIETFAAKMESYAVKSITDAQNRIFNIAAVAAWGILDEIQSLETI